MRKEVLFCAQSAGLCGGAQNRAARSPHARSPREKASAVAGAPRSVIDVVPFEEEDWPFVGLLQVEAV
jgi:hypothetical protein